MPDEGVGNVNGQAADFFPFDFAGKCFMPYTATPNGNIAPTQVGPAGFHIDLALGQQPCNIMGAAPAQSLTQPSSGNGLSPFPLLRFSQSTPQALTTVTLLNLGSLTLTPGTWLVQATGQYTDTSGSVTAQYTQTCIGNVNTNCDSTDFGIESAITQVFGSTGLTMADGFAWSVPTGNTYITVSVPTTIYLNVFASFSGGGLGGDGTMTAQQIY